MGDWSGSQHGFPPQPSLIVSDCSTNGSVQDRPDALKIPNFGIGYSRIDGSVVTSLEPLSSIITVVRWQAFRKQIFFYMRGHVVALLVQFQRSKNIGNLGRAFITLPLVLPQTPGRTRIKTERKYDRVLMQEIGGYCSGLKFYFLPPRSKKRVQE